MEEKLMINLFRCVRLTRGTVTLDETAIHSNRLLPLLVYFIIHRGSPTSNRQLCEQFMGRGYRNPESTLKNLMYRLRTMLKVLGPEEYINTVTGGYQWNPEIEVETDYGKFEQLGVRIAAEQDPGRKKELCAEAAACYNGNFSPGIAEEEWLLPRAIQYQNQYMKIVRELGGIYEKEGQWPELERLCRDVLETEPFEEEIYCWLIRSLHRQQKYNQALEQYEGAKKLFYENFGIWNPSKLQQVFGEIVSDIGVHTTDIGGVLRESCEKERPQGPFFCDYQIFQQIYRLEMRRVSRMGNSEYILLLTVRRVNDTWKEAVTDSGLTAGTAILEGIIRETLRIGDVAARNGPSQFVLLLSSCSYESGVAVAERICRSFRRKRKKLRIDVGYELEEVSSPWLEMDAREDADRQRGGDPEWAAREIFQ